MICTDDKFSFKPHIDALITEELRTRIRFFYRTNTCFWLRFVGGGFWKQSLSVFRFWWCDLQTGGDAPTTHPCFLYHKVGWPPLPLERERETSLCFYVSIKGFSKYRPQIWHHLLAGELEHRPAGAAGPENQHWSGKDRFCTLKLDTLVPMGQSRIVVKTLIDFSCDGF